MLILSVDSILSPILILIRGSVGDHNFFTYFYGSKSRRRLGFKANASPEEAFIGLYL
jgi:hypothetical protein